MRKFALSRGLRAARSHDEATRWNVSDSAVGAWCRFCDLLDGDRAPGQRKRQRSGGAVEAHSWQELPSASLHAGPAHCLPTVPGPAWAWPAQDSSAWSHDGNGAYAAARAAQGCAHATLADHALANWQGPFASTHASCLSNCDWRSANVYALLPWMPNTLGAVAAPPPFAAPHSGTEAEQESRQGSICDLAQLADVGFDRQGSTQPPTSAAASAKRAPANRLALDRYVLADDLLDDVVEQAICPGYAFSSAAQQLPSEPHSWSRSSGNGRQLDLPQCDGAAEAMALPMLTPVPHSFDTHVGAHPVQTALTPAASVVALLAARCNESALALGSTSRHASRRACDTVLSLRARSRAAAS